MNTKELLQNYAKVLVDVGVNLQKGQGLHITVPAEGVELARAVSKYAYSIGASAVTVRFTDEELDENNAVWSDQDLLMGHIQTEYNGMMRLSEQDFAFLRLYSPSFLAAEAGAEKKYESWNLRNAALQSKLRGHTMGHGWTCIACCPTRRWAQNVFPELSAEVALQRLWELLFVMTRSDTDDPVAGWQEFGSAVVAQGEKMTAAAFDAVHIVGPGTDLKLGMIPSHVWGGGRFPNNRGVYAVPNIPTEELATTPDMNRVDGVVSSVRPLNFQGEVVDEFWIRFEKGVAVEWDAKKGKDVLTKIISHDNGSCRLGEVAVVPAGGLIGSTNVVYYCTLLDENATCHLALGAGFPMHVREAEQRALVNQSALHVDFMIGNDQLCIYGLTASGEEVPVFRYGEWTI